MAGREADAGSQSLLDGITVSRRRFLAFGATSATFALTGCVGSTDDSSYATWVPTSDERILTAYFDLTLSQKTSNIDPIVPLVLPASDASEPIEFVPDLSGLNQIDDPLLRFPLQTGGQIIGVSSLSLAFAGLGYLIDQANPTQGVTELILANDTIVGSGDIDVERADEALKSGTPGAFGENQFDVVEQGEEYTYYQLSGERSGTVAVSETAVLVADTLSEVQQVIETHRGNHDRAVTDNETFDWLFDSAGQGDVAVGWVGPLQLDEFYWGRQEPELPTTIGSNDDDIASSVTFAPGSDEITAEFAIRRDGLTEQTSNRLERRLGSSSSDVTATTGNNQFSVTGTYTSDALDVEFVEPTETPTRTPLPDGTALPPKVAEAVPANAFEFEFKKEMSRVRVNFVKNVDADEVTVRATESEFETSSSTTEQLTFLTVAVDRSGDEVVVIVTVDGQSGVVARTQVPPETATPV